MKIFASLAESERRRSFPADRTPPEQKERTSHRPGKQQHHRPPADFGRDRWLRIDRIKILALRLHGRGQVILIVDDHAHAAGRGAVDPEKLGHMLNVPKATAVAWERGQRSPSGAAIRLLQIAKDTPGTLMEVAAGK